MLKILPLAVLVLVTTKGVCLWGNSYLSAYVGQQIITDLRRKLYNHIQTLPLSFFDSRATGDLMSRILNDVTFLQSTATSAVAGVMRECFSIIGLRCGHFQPGLETCLDCCDNPPYRFLPDCLA